MIIMKKLNSTVILIFTCWLVVGTYCKKDDPSIRSSIRELCKKTNEK